MGRVAESQGFHMGRVSIIAFLRYSGSVFDTKISLTVLEYRMIQSQPYSHIRHPLNDLLGTPAHVRLLRLLAMEVSEAIAAPDAAGYTGLTEAGARRALKRLAESGFVERVGSGRTQHFMIRRGDPLMIQLTALFRTEQHRYQSLISQLKELFDEFREIRVAWIDDLPTEAGEPLHIGVLTNSAYLSYLGDEIRRRIPGIESQFELIIEVHPFSSADVPEINWDTAMVLIGTPVSESKPQGKGRTHADHDQREILMNKTIAEILDRDPGLLRRAQQHVENLISQEQGTALHDIQEWRDILTHYSRVRLKDFLLSETPRAQRLRQSSPFFAVLSSAQRRELLDLMEVR